MTEDKSPQNDSLVTSLNEASKLSKHNILILADSVPDPSKYLNMKLLNSINSKLLKKLLKSVGLIIHHFKLGVKIKKNRHKDLLIVYGFSTEFLLLTYFTSLLHTRNVCLLTHHNIQQADQKPIMALFLKIFHYLGYRYIVNETITVLGCVGFNIDEISRHFSLPHPVRNLNPIPSREPLVQGLPSTAAGIKSPRVGLIGNLRSGKNFFETLNLLLSLKEKLDFTLIVGVNDIPGLAGIDLKDAILVETSAYNKYLAAIEYSDVIVLNYEKSQYFYRCSGVAADAIGAGTYVVCPDYPLMSQQVLYPDQVGILYGSPAEFEIALKQALTLVDQSKTLAFENHCKERSAEKIAYILDSKLNDV